MPNSLAQTDEFVCPLCHRAFTMDIWLIVDVIERPDLVQHIHNGDLYAITCPYCAHSGKVDTPLLLYMPHGAPALEQMPLVFSPSEWATPKEAQEQGSRLMHMLAQRLGEAWVEERPVQVVFIPRHVLASSLKDDPEIALRKLFMAGAVNISTQNATELANNVIRAQAAERQYLQMGDLAALDAAVMIWSNILKSSTFVGANKRFQLAGINSAASVSLRRYWARGYLEDLQRSIECWQQAVLEAPWGSPDLPSYLHNLGNGLRDRYEAIGRVADLQEAVRVCELAVQATSEGDPSLPAYLNNLGNGLHERYAATHQLADLENAVSMLMRAVQGMPEGSSDLPKYLNNLGNILRDRYAAFGQIADLHEAIRICRQAAQAVPDNSSDPPMYLINLGNCLRDRYAAMGQLSDLQEAVSVYQRAVQTTPESSPSLSMYLNNLGTALCDRYAVTGQLVDLNEAVHMFEHAVQTTPEGTPKLRGYLSNLSNVLRTRYTATGQMADLEEAVHACERALHADPEGSPDASAVLNNLGNVLQERYRRTGHLADLERAVSMFRRVEQAIPEESPDLPTVLNNLGGGLRELYAATGQLADLEEAVRVCRRAVQVTTEDSPTLCGRLNTLGYALYTWYAATGELINLEEAVRVWERAVETTPEDSPDLPARLNNLGNGLSERYKWLGQMDDLEQAVNVYRAGCVQGALSAPEVVLVAARNWGRWALQREAWAEAVEAYQHGSDKGRLLLARHWGRAQKTVWLRELQAIPAPYAYALARLGRLENAAAAAEAGRARLLAEALERTRRDLDLLPSRGHAQLLTRYQAVVQELNQLTRPPAADNAPDGLSGAARPAAIAAANAEFATVVAAIQQVSGYGDFLTEPGFDRIAPLSARQPLVYLLATVAGGLALIVHAGAVQPIWLDDLTAERLDSLLLVRDEENRVTGGYLMGQIKWEDEQIKWRTELRRHLSPLLVALGELVAQPLAAALHSLPGAPAAFTLIPSGRLALLPLHAAPLADGRTLQDVFAVRYAPSSVAAAAAQQRPLVAGQRPLLALADPHGPQTHPAAFTDWLGGRAAATLGGGPPLLYAQAGATGLRAQLAAGAPAHLLFGCHGIFAPAEPLKSGLELADGRLTLAQLLDDLRLDGVDLVTLCACQTAVADFNDLENESLGLPAAILQAGARRVVGTLWPVDGFPTAMLLEHYFGLLAAGVAVETALAQSAAWLRTLPRAEAARRLQTVLAGAQDVDSNLVLHCEMLVSAAPQPFAHPVYWAAFTCTGAGAAD